MHIRSIFIWPIISFICTSFGSDVSNEVTQFGFKTAVADGSYTPATILITLWFGSTIYQGSTSAPDGQNIWYTLTMQNKPYFSVIERNCSKITQAKIMFELDATDAVGIDQVRVDTQSGDWYGINKHYRESSLDDVIWIDNEAWHHAPYKQIVYFDTTRPNVFIDDAAWSDGTNVYSRSPSNTHQCSRLSTPIYGGDGGEFYSVLNQGRVYAMLDWGLASNKYLQIRGWQSDSQTTDTVYGVGTSRSSCTSFSLSSDDYITRYQIWVSSNGITGLKFWTRNDRIVSCIGTTVSTDSTTTSYAKNYEYGAFNFSYLTGWNVRSGSYIDQLQFQFTESSLTTSPTQVTNNPSQTPSSNTNNPSQTPSSNPTNRPISTNDPSTISSQTPSQAPSVNATYTNPMETEQNERSIKTTEIVSSQRNHNKDTTAIMAVILSVLVLCCVCTSIAICVYMKKYNIKIPIMTTKVASVDNDDVNECDVKRNDEKQHASGPKVIQTAVRSLSGHDTINAELVMSGSAIMTKGKHKIELVVKDENALKQVEGATAIGDAIDAI
eukprot:742350_1